MHLLQHQATDLVKLAVSLSQHTCRKVSTSLAQAARAQQGATNQHHLNGSVLGASAVQAKHPPREPTLKPVGKRATKKKITTHPLLETTNDVNSIRAQNAHLPQSSLQKPRSYTQQLGNTRPEAHTKIAPDGSQQAHTLTPAIHLENLIPGRQTVLRSLRELAKPSSLYPEQALLRRRRPSRENLGESR